MRIFLIVTCTLFLQFGALQSLGQESIDDALTARIEKDFQKETEKRERDRKLKGNTFIMKLLDIGSEHPEILDMLELVDSQKEKIKELVGEFRAREKELIEQYYENPNRDKLVRSKMMSFKSEIKEQLFEVLFDFQLESLADMNVLSIGLPHVLTESKIGDAIKLTKAQKERIRKKSNDLAKRVEAFIHESRKEAYGIVNSELNDKQKKTMNSLFSEQILNSYSENLSMRSLFAHFRYFENDKPKYPMTPVMKTPIEELKQSK